MIIKYYIQYTSTSEKKNNKSIFGTQYMNRLYSKRAAT